MQTQKHEELLAKIDELNIVRESNATLRLESKFANERIQGLVSELEALRAEVGPLKRIFIVFSMVNVVRGVNGSANQD